MQPEDETKQSKLSDDKTETSNVEEQSDGSCLAFSICGWVLTFISLWIWRKMFSPLHEFFFIFACPAVLIGIPAFILHLVAACRGSAILRDPQKPPSRFAQVGCFSSVLGLLILALGFFWPSLFICPSL